MKKISMIISVFILCGTACIAQNKIDETDFEHLIDYANCQYLMAFIEKGKNNKISGTNTNENEVMSELKKADLSDIKQIPDYNKIKKLVQKISNGEALLLAEKINNRKAEYKNSTNNEDLIKSLMVYSWKTIELKDTAKKIEKFVRNKYNINPVLQGHTEVGGDSGFSKIKELQEKNRILQGRVLLLEKQLKKIEGKIIDASGYRFIKAVILLLIVSFVLCLLFMKGVVERNIYKSKKLEKKYLLRGEEKNIMTKLERYVDKLVVNGNESNHASDLKDVQVKVVYEEKDINKIYDIVCQKVMDYVNEELTVWKKNMSTEGDQRKNIYDSKLEQKSVLLGEKDIMMISDRVIKYMKDEQNKFVEISCIACDKKDEDSDSKYFRSKNKNIFIEELKNSKDASFRVFDIRGDEAKYEYCGGVVNQDYFMDVCSFTNNPSDIPKKTKITTVTHGVVKKDSINGWMVKEKAKIKFE